MDAERAGWRGRWMRREPEIAIEGIGALHRVDSADRDTVRAWRNAPAVRAAMYAKHEISEAEHEAWWAQMMADPARLYCIAAAPDGPLGVVGFTALQDTHGEGHWAFYAAPDAPRGAGRRMEALALELAFGPLGLERLICEVRQDNERVIALHAGFGFVRDADIVRQTPGGAVMAVRMVLTGDDWQARREARLADIAGRGGAA